MINEVDISVYKWEMWVAGQHASVAGNSVTSQLHALILLHVLTMHMWLSSGFSNFFPPQIHTLYGQLTNTQTCASSPNCCHRVGSTLVS